MSLVALCSLYLPKSFNFIEAFNCYKQKCKLAPFNLAHPVSLRFHYKHWYLVFGNKWTGIVTLLTQNEYINIVVTLLS